MTAEERDRLMKALKAKIEEREEETLEEPEQIFEQAALCRGLDEALEIVRAWPVEEPQP